MHVDAYVYDSVCFILPLVLHDAIVQNSSYMSKLETRKLRLRQLKAKYEKEETEWERLLEESTLLEEGTAVVEEDAAALADAAKRGRESIEKDSLRNSIASACVTTSGKLGLTVDALCGMVDNVRRICNAADDKSRLHAKEFMKESFKSFSHVNDPMHLVSQLAKK